LTPVPVSLTPAPVSPQDISASQRKESFKKGSEEGLTRIQKPFQD